MTAAYMTRCVLPHVLRRVRGPTGTRTSRPRITVPLIDPGAVCAIVAGFANLPERTGAARGLRRCASSTTSSQRRTSRRLEHARSSPRRSPSSRSVALGGARLASSPTPWSSARGRATDGITERNRVAPAPAYTVLVEQVLLRLALHRRHRRRDQGPDRPGRLLVQPERHRRRRQRARAPASVARRPSGVYKYDRPERGRRRRQRLGHRSPSERRGAPPASRPARCSSTPRCSSAAPPSSPASSSSFV